VVEGSVNRTKRRKLSFWMVSGSSSRLGRRTNECSLDVAVICFPDGKIQHVSICS
jgi:hypothetical protein